MVGACLVGVVGDCLCEDGLVVECVYGESSLTAVCLKNNPKKTNYGLIKTAPFCEKTSVRCPTKNIDRNPHDTNLRHNYHTSRKAYKKSKHLNSQIEDLNVTKYKERKTVLHKRT